MKLDRSSLLTLVYCLFTLLYTLYIAGHPGNFGAEKGNKFIYQAKFLLISGYLFFILQGLILRSKNWGILLLLPLCVLIATIVISFLMVGILRLGGGTLLDNDYADMILLSLCWLAGSIYALKFISTGKKAGKQKRKQ